MRVKRHPFVAYVEIKWICLKSLDDLKQKLYKVLGMSRNKEEDCLTLISHSSMEFIENKI